MVNYSGPMELSIKGTGVQENSMVLGFSCWRSRKSSKVIGSLEFGRIIAKATILWIILIE
jgi:hypothetical protein